MLVPIKPLISLIQAPNRGKFPYCHCLFIDGRQKVLIDNGFGQENLALVQKLKPDILLCSHFHEDHTVNIPHFPAAQVWIHAADAPPLTSPQNFFDFYGFSLYGGEEIGWNFINSWDIQPCTVHHEIQDGEILDLGTSSWQVIHLPGHSPGHCGFWEPEAQILFTGDIELSSFGPWYGHICSDVGELIASIRKCIDLDPQMIISSHKGILIDNLRPQLYKYLDVVLRRQEAFRKLLERPSSIEELAQARLAYGEQRGGEPFVIWMEKMFAHLHVQHLMDLGEVRQDGAVFFRK